MPKNAHTGREGNLIKSKLVDGRSPHANDEEVSLEISKPWPGGSWEGHGFSRAAMINWRMRASAPGVEARSEST